MCYNLSSAVSTVTELDKDGDGIADTTTIKKTDTDENGKNIDIVTVLEDTDDDGTPDTITNTIVDKHNQTTVEKGTVLSSEEGIITVKFDVDKFDDGKGISGRTDRITRDGKGEVLDSSFDFYDDGTQDKKISYEYNDDGTIKQEYIDLNVDGVPEELISYEYKDGELYKKTKTVGGDVSSEMYVYNDDGTLHKVFYDKDNNGVPESSKTYTYYEGSENIKTVSSDNNNDGKPEKVETFEYDANNYVTKAITDTDGDGQPNKIVSYEVDSKGRTVKMYEDLDGDAQPEKLTKYEYNDHNQYVVRNHYSLNENGEETHTNIVKKEYDEQGRTIKVENNILSSDTIAINNFEYNQFDQNTKNVTMIKRDASNEDSTFTMHSEQERFYNSAHELSYIGRDLAEVDGHYDWLFTYEDFSLPKDEVFKGLSKLWIQTDDVLTISEEALDSISNNSGHKLYIYNKYYSTHADSASVSLEGNFTKTGAGVYTDEAGNALIVDPDITVNIV
ncbi:MULTISPECIES: hypothetical protein [Pasteurellaceae]|uniref:hypothetical protein n=1 Tax=Pasteurellaceae TaxID=712 RepID=UPI002762DECC|nr:hypothetical protein [Pasteurella atlantica]MDP8034569.1 hypothetical protein [Pasteurella atlantica]MDP8050741.1 hypothetical protein [Pasteurella atlantica]MDP8082303.1 hypothetical protein [Pasteurella atlantica]MDP8088278.1 hypothetical protein [Pasteurella atlantica]MDP8103989.1 hypothetical protein [Pasteurella atlantica]